MQVNNTRHASALARAPGGLLFSCPMRFDKPALSVDDQIELLVMRGMTVPDREQARHYLLHLNYYRLRAYWLPFELVTGTGEHRFRPGTTFDNAISLYVFDRKLRLLVMDGIERAEVSIRTSWAYTLARRYGPHAHLDSGLFRDGSRYDRSLTDLRTEIARSHETFVEHFRTKYTSPELPPIWACCEVLTIGQLSQWFSNLARRSDRRAIAEPYTLDEAIMRSVLHHLTVIRNLCAHHARLWNRRLTVTLPSIRRPTRLALSMNPDDRRKLYNTLVLLAHVLGIISPESEWRRHLATLLSENPLADPSAMGFPAGWIGLPMWVGAT